MLGLRVSNITNYVSIICQMPEYGGWLKHITDTGSRRCLKGFDDTPRSTHDQKQILKYELTGWKYNISVCWLCADARYLSFATKALDLKWI